MCMYVDCIAHGVICHSATKCTGSLQGRITETPRIAEADVDLWGLTPAQAGPSRAGCPGLWWGSFWKLSMRRPHNLGATCASAVLGLAGIELASPQKPIKCCALHLFLEQQWYGTNFLAVAK